VALVSSAGIALKTDVPFDQETERQQPWWGDPSYRCLPNTATEQDVRLYHLHIDPSDAEKDLNCLFPLKRLAEMEQAGRIGHSSHRHYSIMGYILNPEVLLSETVPALIRDLREDLADVVVLVPA
jgi:D-proline reductase (dithiol) PrdB